MSDDRFPETRVSAVLAARSHEEAARRAAMDRIIGAYWKPVFKYLRLRWKADHDQAADWTQAFFTRLLEREFVQSWDPERGHFRTWLRVGIDGFVANEKKAAGRQKRGGGRAPLSLDFDGAERELGPLMPMEMLHPERCFEQEWARALFDSGIAALRDDLESNGRALRWRIFEATDLAHGERPSYRELAGRFREPETQITNHLAAARRQLRQILSQRLRDLTGSDEEYDFEAGRLFGTKERV
ncbi:MAG TPA: hypothetical protein VF720_01305 [Candidatus Eisenbacteria bacterium]